MNKKLDWMVDLETLDTQYSTVILSCGIVTFNRYSNTYEETLMIKPDVDEQVSMGRTQSESTIQWWERQTPEAIAEAFSEHDRVSFSEFTEAVYKFTANRDCAWSHGSNFDIPILEHALKMAGLNVPWSPFKVRDTRTLFDITNVSLRDNGFVTSHRVLDDALNQVTATQRAFKILSDLR